MCNEHVVIFIPIPFCIFINYSPVCSARSIKTLSQAEDITYMTISIPSIDSPFFLDNFHEPEALYFIKTKKIHWKKKFSILIPLCVGFKEKNLEFWNSLKLKIITLAF